MLRRPATEALGGRNVCRREASCGTAGPKSSTGYPISRCIPARTILSETNQTRALNLTARLAGSSRFLDTRWHSFRPVAARSAEPMLATLGGDVGEIALALEAHGAVTGRHGAARRGPPQSANMSAMSAVFEASAESLVSAFVARQAVPGQRPLYAWIERSAVDAIRAKLPAPAGAAVDLAAPPAELREAILELVVQPELAGEEYRAWALAAEGPRGRRRRRRRGRRLGPSSALCGPRGVRRRAPRGLPGGPARPSPPSSPSTPPAGPPPAPPARPAPPPPHLSRPSPQREPGGGDGGAGRRRVVNAALAARFLRRSLAALACRTLAGCSDSAPSPRAPRPAPPSSCAPPRARPPRLAPDRPAPPHPARAQLDVYSRAAAAGGAVLASASVAAHSGFGGMPGGAGRMGAARKPPECVATHVGTELEAAPGTIPPDADKLAAFVAAQELTFVDPTEHTWSCVDGRTAHPALGTPGGTLAEFLLALSAFERAAPSFVLDEDTVQALLDEFVDRYALPPGRQFYAHTSVHAQEDLAAYVAAAQAADVAAAEPPAALRPALLGAVALIKFIGCSHLRYMLMQPEVYRTNPAVVGWAVRSFYRALWADGALGGGRLLLEVLEGDHAEGFLAVVSTAGCPGHEAPFNPTPLGPPAFDSSRPEAFVLHEASLRAIRGYTASFFAGAAPNVSAADLAADMQAAFPAQVEHTLAALAPGVARVHVLVSAAPSAALFDALDADAAAASGRHVVGFALALPSVPCAALTVPVLANLKPRVAARLDLPPEAVLITGLECGAGDENATAAAARLTLDLLVPRFTGSSALWASSDLLARLRSAAGTGALSGSARRAPPRPHASPSRRPRRRGCPAGALAALLALVGVALSGAACFLLLRPGAPRGRPAAPPRARPRRPPARSTSRRARRRSGQRGRSLPPPGRASKSFSEGASPASASAGASPRLPEAPAPAPAPALSSGRATPGPAVSLYPPAERENPFAYAEGRDTLFLNPFAEPPGGPGAGPPAASLPPQL
eukprot:tig00001187_g7453.t1